MYDIVKELPMVRPVRPNFVPRRKYPFEHMEVGDMFFIPYRTTNTFTAHASTQGKALNRKFTTRLIRMLDVDGTWVPAAKTDEGAVTGIGVWRTR